ncbi:hypothetical protein C1646_759432 [Rhizophagus diaphanus]|nr:hypothetical protein C1646_759432 [Rhizophagus diaphanus] [Rhizophagus sp. MUCL 43196]
MLQLVKLSIIINELKVVIIFDDRYHNEESLSINHKYKCEIESETSEGDESDISAALNEVSFQLKRINEKPNNLSIINGGDSVDNEYQFLLNDNLNFESLTLQSSRYREANVSKDILLIKGNYVFIKYGNQMCIDNVSYISLHVYIPIHLDLFSDIVQKDCYILTHHLASNIFYHILPSGILIEGNILKLLGNEKKYYFKYFERKDISRKSYKIINVICFIFVLNLINKIY